jgi:hypothetical protein
VKVPKQPAIRLSGPASGSGRSLEALTDDELAQRKTETLDALQRIIDEQERRRWGLTEPRIVYVGGDPNLRAAFD